MAKSKNRKVELIVPVVAPEGVTDAKVVKEVNAIIKGAVASLTALGVRVGGTKVAPAPAAATPDASPVPMS
jgi:hypothetical protein